ncbi:hypothetical protein F5B19DRAFT_461986 [Rostrohypoxylon terebratum]|nr:hypothetical protein F5B19DRAFT_461986 [Rostrohypoxylon terebratum]
MHAEVDRRSAGGGTAFVREVYERPSTLHHSLEASIGVIEFDKVKIRLGDDGSMCGFISSTVAYLIYSSTWDQETAVTLP